MKKTIGTLMCALTLLVLMCSLAVPAMAVIPDAEAPVWEEGKKWAYGSEMDVGAEFEDQLSDLADMLVSETNGTVNELSLDGSTAMWLLFEVTTADSDKYVLSAVMAAKIELDAAVSVTADMNKAGTYDYFEEPDTEEMTASLELSIDIALLVEVDVTFDKDTMAIRSMEMDVGLNGAVSFAAENIPMDEDNWSAMTTTYWYEDYDVSATIEADLSLDLEFSPALNIWDFPLGIGDEWTVDSMATLSGSLTGSVDMQGLPDDMMDDIFSEEFVDQTGFSDFPIIFEELSGDGFENGVIEEVSEEIVMDLKCTSAVTVDDDYWGEITIYKIKVQDSPMEFYYSPDVGFMSYFSMNTGDINDVIDLPLPGMISQDMTMNAVDPAVAEEGISEISDYQGGIDDGDGGIMAFFTEAPYLGLILVIAIVIVIVVALVLIRKK